MPGRKWAHQSRSSRLRCCSRTCGGWFVFIRPHDVLTSPITARRALRAG